MKITIGVETHAHTIATAHAYSTVTEMCAYAASIGLEGLCITDHAPMLENGVPHPFHFSNLSMLPRVIEGVRVIRGVELNLCDYQGGVDLNGDQLEGLEWIIASIHSPCLAPSSVEKITQTYLAALENPAVDCLGHIGQARYVCDYETVVKEAANRHKIIEINNNSVNVRRGSLENCIKVAKLCKQYGVNVCVSTDAHYHTMLGQFRHAMDILKEVVFPEELIVNRNINTFRDYILERKGVDILK